MGLSDKSFYRFCQNNVPFRSGFYFGTSTLETELTRRWLRNLFIV